MFTARYGLSTYITQVRFVFKGLIYRRYLNRPFKYFNVAVMNIIIEFRS